MKRLTVYLGDGLYIQNPEEVDGKIVGDRRCLQRLAQYENLFESWGIGEVDFDLAKLTTLYRVVFLLQKKINFFQKSVDKCLLM